MAGQSISAAFGQVSDSLLRNSRRRKNGEDNGTGTFRPKPGCTDHRCQPFFHLGVKIFPQKRSGILPLRPLPNINK